MTVRLTPTGAIVQRFVDGKWVTSKGLTIPDLRLYVEFQPGVTVGQIVSAVESSPALKQFFEAFCYLDFDEMKENAGDLDWPVMIPTGIEPAEEKVEGKLQNHRITGYAPADHIRIEREMLVCHDTADPYMLDGYFLSFRSVQTDGGIGLGVVTYHDVKDIEVVLQRELCITRDAGGVELAKGEVRHNLLNVLKSILDMFGDRPSHENWTQKNIDETQAAMEKMKQMFGRNEDDEENDDDLEEDDEEQ